MNLVSQFDELAIQHEKTMNNGKKLLSQMLVMDNQTINEEDNHLYELRRAGAWAIRESEEKIALGENTIIAVAFHPERLHIGHMALINELSTFANSRAMYYIIKTGHTGHNENEKQVKMFTQIMKMKGIDDHRIHVTYDYECNEIRRTENTVNQLLTVNRLVKCMGWDTSRKMADLCAVTREVASFLAFQNEKDLHAFWMSDINQLPFERFALEISNRMKMKMPTICYTRMIPSLKDVRYRMSIKNKEQALFLDEDIESVENKLKHSRTAMVNSQGFDRLQECTFVRIANVFLSEKEMHELLAECVLLNGSCSSCKRIGTHIITRKMRRIKDDTKDIC